MRTKPLFRPLSPQELSFVMAAKTNQLSVPAREDIVHAGGNGRLMYTLFDGWAFRYKALPGGARQILDFLLPGDLIGLQSPLTGKVRHSVSALTPVSICEIAGQPVRTIFEEQPALGSALVETLLLDEDRADRRLLLLGRQRPTQRLAYLMLEIQDRLQARGLSDGGVSDFPLTYDHMADALGLSRAQLARSLAELRERDWARLSGSILTIQAADAMRGFSAYEATATEQRALI